MASRELMFLNRENLLASTDTLDLLGIAKTLLSRRARITGDTSSSAATYHHLREITRCRRTLVRQQTAASNRIHALADQLFPGFLNGSNKITRDRNYKESSCRIVAHLLSYRHGTREMDCSLGGFGDEAGDLPLPRAGGGQALCLRAG